MAHPLRVLFIGETGAEAVGAELRQAQFEPFFRCIGTEAQLHASLAEDWDIAISDFTVGDFGALDALKTIHERASISLSLWSPAESGMPTSSPF